MKNINRKFMEKTDKFENFYNENKKKFINQDYVDNKIAFLESKKTHLDNRYIILAAAEKRKLNKPHMKTKNGNVRGRWQDNVFIFDDKFIPKNFNEKNNTIKQIKKKLNEKYGIELDGIKFVDGVPNFKNISIINIPLEEVIIKRENISRECYNNYDIKIKAKLFDKYFGKTLEQKDKRMANFEYVNDIVVERKIQLPGLKKNYTKKEFKIWCKDNNFMWDEQVYTGYSLVPSVIHGNLSHTGLVSISKKSNFYMKQREDDLEENFEYYCWEENEAPININDAELIKNQYRKKGYSKMKRKIEIKNIEQYIDDYSKLEEEIEKYMIKNDGLLEKSIEEYEKPKMKLEKKIKEININKRISREDKIRIIEKLNCGIEELKCKYEKEINKEKIENQQKINAILDLLTDGINEYDQQNKSFNSLEKDISLVDISSIKEIILNSKEILQKIKNVNEKKLQKQNAKFDEQSKK